jgi:hypothetical protein
LLFYLADFNDKQQILGELKSIPLGRTWSDLSLQFCFAPRFCTTEARLRAARGCRKRRFLDASILFALQSASRAIQFPETAAEKEIPVYGSEPATAFFLASCPIAPARGHASQKGARDVYFRRVSTGAFQGTRRLRHR